MNTNNNIFEMIKAVKSNSYDSYGMFNRRKFTEALKEQVKGIDKIELVHLVQDFRTASELFEMDVTFFKYNTANGGHVVDVNFEEELVAIWKEANKNVTRVVTSGRCKRVIDVNDFGI